MPFDRKEPNLYLLKQALDLAGLDVDINASEGRVITGNRIISKLFMLIMFNQNIILIMNEKDFSRKLNKK